MDVLLFLLMWLILGALATPYCMWVVYKRDGYVTYGEFTTILFACMAGGPMSVLIVFFSILSTLTDGDWAKKRMLPRRKP